MKKHVLQFKSLTHYYIGALLFFSGLAKLHIRLHELSMRQLQRAADGGLNKAQLLFGQILTYKGATVYNKIAGVKYLRELALKGSKDAQFMLAEAIVNPDFIETMSHSFQNRVPQKGEAELHDPNNTSSRRCQSHVQDSSHETINLEDPAALYRSAAELGHIMAALRLSKLYRQGGYGVSIDTEKAEYWLEEFMKQGNQY